MNPSTKRTLIFLGIIAAVVIVLFVITAVHKPASGGCSTSDLETWRGSSKPVGPGQLSGCATALGTIVIPVTCDLRIAKADERSRQLVIHAIDAKLKITIHMDADGRPLTLEPEITAGEHKQFSIGKDEQTIRLHCDTNSSCHARLQ